MKAWVTGGAGFLGSHIAEALAAAGHTVTVVDDFSTGVLENLEGAGVQLLQYSVQHSEVEVRLGAERPEAIFHLAGDARVGKSMEDPRSDCERNLLPTLALLEAIRRASPETKLLFASTGAVYGGDAREPFTEGDGLYPVSPYAVSKLGAERYCYAFAQSFGLRTCNLRLFSIYGPRQRKQVVYDLIRKVHENPERVPLFGDGTQERDFSHVGNIVDAFLLAAERAEFRGEAINVAGDEIASIRTLAALIAEEMGERPEFVFSGQQRPGDSQRWIADTARLRAMGYRPRVGLREGLRDTIDWFRRSQSV